MVRKFRRTRKRTRRRRGGKSCKPTCKKYMNAINTWKQVDEDAMQEWRAGSKTIPKWNSNLKEWYRQAKEEGGPKRWRSIQKRDNGKRPGFNHPSDRKFYDKYKDAMPAIIKILDISDEVEKKYEERTKEIPTDSQISLLKDMANEMETYGWDEPRWEAIPSWLEPAMKKLPNSGGRKKSRRKSRRRKKSTKKKRRRRKKRSRRRRK
tara:strand:- start:87 stop:707 length:621 start_codon:yes stop_codon:yes gene_type:complete